MRHWFIYALADSEEVRYIGWTVDPRRRLRRHLDTAKTGKLHRECWIRSVVQAGGQIQMYVLEEGEGDWAEAERRWIAHYREMGARLTNLTDGGEGVSGLVFSEETRQRLREHAIARGCEHLLRLARERIGKPGHKLGPEHVEKLRQLNRERIWTPEMRRKVSQTVSRIQKGRKFSEQRCQNISRSLLGRKLSPEHIASMRKPRRPLTVEEKAKISASLRGRIFSDEHRRNLSKAGVNGWNKRRSNA